MILILGMVAFAATISVGPDGPALQSVIDGAQPGDIVQLRAGDYSVNVEIASSLTLMGEDGVRLSPSSSAPVISAQLAESDWLKLENLRVTGWTSGAISQTGGGLSLHAVELDEGTGSYAGLRLVGGSALTLEDVSFQSNTARAVDAEATAIALRGVGISRVVPAGGSVLGLRGGVVTLEDVTTLDSSGVNLVNVTATTDLILTRVSVGCSQASASAVALDAPQIEATALRVWRTPSGSPLVSAVGNSQVRYASLQSDVSNVLLSVSGANASLSGLALMGPSTCVAGDASTTLNYSVLGCPTGVLQAVVSDAVLAEAPQWWALGEAACDDDLMGPMPGGNLHNSGPTAALDRDGTRADIGATGGPDGFEFSVPADADEDGYPSVAAGGEDCDDLSAAAHPGAEEDLGGADLDCDGAPDPAARMHPAGCEHGEFSTFWLVAMLALRRRSARNWR